MNRHQRPALRQESSVCRMLRGGRGARDQASKLLRRERAEKRVSPAHASLGNPPDGAGETRCPTLSEGALFEAGNALLDGRMGGEKGEQAAGLTGDLQGLE